MASKERLEDRLRKLAVVACMLQTFVTSAIPAVEYYYVYQLDNLGIGPQAWTTWAVAVLTGLLGVMAHGGANTALTVVHLVAGTLLGAALGAYCTAWWFVLQLQCSVAQAAFGGCPACPCAQTSTCSAADLAAPSCAACEAPPADLCAAVHQTYNIYLLAFTGLTALLAALPALVLDVKLLMATSARLGAASARKQAIRVAVDQQTRLITAGDKPTVTPGTLGDWVSSLTASGDATLVASADKCRGALRARGYELPLRGSSKLAVGPAQAGGLFRTATGLVASPDAAGGGGGSVGAESTAGGFDDVFDAAERGDGKGGRGAKRAKPQQVTPEQTPAVEAPFVGMP